MTLFLLIFGHVAISSLTHVLTRGVLRDEHVPPEIVVAARSAAAVIALIPLGVFGRLDGAVRARLERRDWIRLLAVAGLAVPANQLFYLHGLKYTHATHGALLFCLTPLVVGVLRRVIDRERTSRGAWIGSGIAIAGVTVIFARSVMASSTAKAGADLLLGDAILLGAVLSWSLLTIFSRPLLAKMPSFTLARSTLLLGAALLVPFVIGPVIAFDWSSLSPRAWSVFVFLGVGTSVVAYALWNSLLRRLGPVRSAVLVTLQPVAVGLLAWRMLDEPVTPELFFGGALVIAGVITAQRAKAGKGPLVASA